MHWSNYATANEDKLARIVHQGRLLHLQRFNNYWAEFVFDRYTDFIDTTGDASLAKQLEEFYGHVDAVKWYPGSLPNFQFS